MDLEVLNDINDLAIECKDDAGLFSEKVQVLSARRKRLYEDYEKDEKEDWLDELEHPVQMIKLVLN